MRSISNYIILIATTFISITGFSQPGNWSYIGPNPYYYGGTFGWFQDITFCDSLHGFAFDGFNPRIMITADGGANWKFKHSPTLANCGQFLNSQLGWITDGYHISKTSDGCNSWIAQFDSSAFDRSNSIIWSLDIIDPLNAFAPGQYYLGKTTDGGNTWTNIAPLQIDSSWREAYFLNPDTGWIFSADSTIAKTMDGGQTWTKQTVSPAYPGNSFSSGYFYNANIGVALTQSGVEYRTNNGGNSWTMYPDFIGSTDIASAKFGANGLVYALDYPGDSLFVSGDSAKTWRHLAPPGSLFAVYFSSPSDGYVGQTNIYKTTNGGTTWTSDVPSYPQGGAYAILDIGWTSPTNVIALKTGNAIQSTDNGVNWIQNTNLSISNIQEVNSNCYFIENGSYSGIDRYQNGSLTYSNSNYIFHFVYASSADSFIVATQFNSGDSLHILRTTNGGATWTSILDLYDPNGINIGEGPTNILDLTSSRYGWFTSWDTGVVAYLGTGGSKEFVTLNGGVSWTSPAGNLPDEIVSVKRSPNGGLFSVRQGSSSNYSLCMWNSTNTNWEFISFVDGSINNLGGEADVDWSSDNILWANNIFNGGTTSFIYSLDDGNTWNTYPLLMNGITMLKHAGDKFICGTTEGELLQYDGTQYNCRMSGHVFYDFNRNGVFDGYDVDAASFPVNVAPTGAVVYTSPNGDYLTAADSGTYTLSPTTIYNYQPTPASIPVSFNSQTGSSTGNNFALQPVDTSLHDLYLGIIEGLESAPGFNHTTYISYANQGVQPAQPVLVFVLDTSLTYVSALPAPTMQNGDSIIWNLPGINPLQSNSITLTTRLSTGAQLGQSVQNAGIILPVSGDYAPDDNTDTSVFTVLGSFDPNFKVAKPATVPLNQTYHQSKLQYTIEFQNTGTASAHFVVVRDQLPASLNPGTLKILASSAPCDFHMETGNVAVFRFNNINLPDSSSDINGSRGFVSFLISPLNINLQTDTIYNSADIYFDYNSPVTTNAAKIYVNGALTEIKPVFGNLNISVYPNPASNIIHVESTEDFVAKLYDLSGRPVLEGRSFSGHTTFNINNLASGLYLLEALQKGERQTYSIAVVTANH